MAYKLFITDLDGTLLDDRKGIPPENRQAIQRLLDHEIHCTVFTGRSYHSGVEIVQELGIQIPVAFQNGALIMNPMTSEKIHQRAMSSQVAGELILEGRAQGFFAIAYTSFMELPDMFVEGDLSNPHPKMPGAAFPFRQYLDSNAWRLRQVSDLYEKVMAQPEIPQICLIGEMEPLTRWMDGFHALHDGHASMILSAVEENVGFLEFFGPEVSKSHALDELLKYYHVLPEETVFIGDNLNDVDLMKRVGVPIAVDNAPPEVKAHCLWIAPSNEEAGVARAIEHFFFGEKSRGMNQYES